MKTETFHSRKSRFGKQEWEEIFFVSNGKTKREKTNQKRNAEAKKKLDGNADRLESFFL